MIFILLWPHSRAKFYLFATGPLGRVKTGRETDRRRMEESTDRASGCCEWRASVRASNDPSIPSGCSSDGGRGRSRLSGLWSERASGRVRASFGA